MRVVDEQPTETLHLYVVPEDQLPKKPDYPSLFMVCLGLLCILALMGLSAFSAAPIHEVAFTVTLQGFRLAPAGKTFKTTIIATGKGHTAATHATGMLTFYNGLPYTQIIPGGTQLTDADGVSVLTDEQAIIPPAAQTTPPTYGHTNVLAHSLLAGASGNIQAGDINIACCVTSVIVQNPYNFTGGRNARDFTFLTTQDVTNATSSLLPMLQTKALSLLPPPQLHPHCSPTTHASPGVGKEAQSAQLMIVETCTADSYRASSLAHAITTYSTRFGTGTLTHVQFFVASVTEGKGVRITLYVVAQWHLLVVRRFPGTGK
jgi:Baseplate J-like protein